MKFLIALLKLGSVERMEDTCLKKFFFTHFHFDVKVNFFLLKILSAGSEPTVFHWQINGDPKTHVPCTPNSVFTMQINDQSPKNKVLAVGGCSADIDVFTNFGYKALSFKFSQ